MGDTKLNWTTVRASMFINYRMEKLKASLSNIYIV